MVFRWSPPIQPLPAFWKKGSGSNRVDRSREQVSSPISAISGSINDHVAWLDLLSRLDQIEKGSASRRSRLQSGRSEVSAVDRLGMRQRILKLRQSGREVTVHMDRAKLSLYTLASAADHVTMDRAGSIAIPGIRTAPHVFPRPARQAGIGIRRRIRELRYKSAIRNVLPRHDVRSGSRAIRTLRRCLVRDDSRRDHAASGR
jgi:hypothetical protein